MFNLNSKEKIAALAEWKELLTNLIVILLCLGLFSFFPAQDFFQKIIREIFFFLIVPLLYIKLVLKKNLANFGFRLPAKRADYFWAIGALICLAIIFLILIRFTDFEKSYLVSSAIKNDFSVFLLYELVAFNFLFLLQELFFKGFVLFSFMEIFKLRAIFAVALIFSLVLIIAKDFTWQTAPLIVYSLAGSLIAYKSKSAWLSYFTGLIFIISLDAFLIYISK